MLGSKRIKGDTKSNEESKKASLRKRRLLWVAGWELGGVAHGGAARVIAQRGAEPLSRPCDADGGRGERVTKGGRGRGRRWTSRQMVCRLVVRAQHLRCYFKCKGKLLKGLSRIKFLFREDHAGRFVGEVQERRTDRKLSSIKALTVKVGRFKV